MKNKKPIWAIFANTHGLWYKNPQLCEWNKDLKSWWTKDERLDIKRIGLLHKGDHVCFSSYNKRDVRSWIIGFKSVLKLLKEFVDSGD